uniref:Putative ovule protein n=1 Tax=Solanum chacoense TaxID=4108 RepID=A0A0V0GK29_SOLCH
MATRCTNPLQCLESGEGPDHNNLLYTALPSISARLFPHLEPVTSWSHGNNFTNYLKKRSISLATIYKSVLDLLR